jgi:hypothetical protein
LQRRRHRNQPVDVDRADFDVTSDPFVCGIANDRIYFDFELHPFSERFCARGRDNVGVKVLQWLRLNPPLAEGIRRYGFRKWYERELIFSHIYLALALVALAGLLGAIEVFSSASLLEKIMDVAFVVICAAVVFVAAQGYLSSLADAETVANQATCGECKTYGRLEVASEERASDGLHVSCKRCGHRWRIDTF